MKISVLLAAAVGALAVLLSPVEASRSSRLVAIGEAQRQAAFVNFVKTHGKSYPTDEFLMRYNIFSAHLKTITAHNAEAAQGKHSWTMAVNEYSDLSFAEFKQQRTGYKPFDHGTEQPTMDTFEPEWANLTAPDFVDLRQQGLVTNVKDQQQCGGCWAFSAVASIEAARKRAHNVLFSMSEQQMIDCAPQSLGCGGCNGGNIEGAFQWAINNGGLTNIENYPFVTTHAGASESCRSVHNDASFSSYKRLPADEGAIRDAVSAGNVVSIAINVADSFQHYSAGIYTGDCSKQRDHAIAVVGYGHDQPSGKDFFIVKNSWGAGWGVSGYIYMQRGVDLCGLADDASYMQA